MKIWDFWAFFRDGRRMFKRSQRKKWILDFAETCNTLSLDEKIEKKLVKQENFLMGLKIDFEFSKILFRISLYKIFIKRFPL